MGAAAGLTCVFALPQPRLAQDGGHPTGPHITRNPCCRVQGWLLAAHAAIVATVATAAWLLRPPRRTYLVDWYSFRPPERMAVSIDDMKDGIERKKAGSGLAPAAMHCGGSLACTKTVKGYI